MFGLFPSTSLSIIGGHLGQLLGIDIWSIPFNTFKYYEWPFGLAVRE